ncbi:MAG: amino acid ABC transporter, partial [Rhizobiales bacterium]|nr:amino acid ABC transporter [Hyphomicrobiales bacterium]
MKLSISLKAALFGVAALALAGTAARADQLADIKAAGKIVTATDMHYAPFDMIVDGNYEGMTKDLFDQVSKEI